MIDASIPIVCTSLLFAQYRSHKHARSMRSDLSRLESAEARIAQLEKAKEGQFDSKAFEDLQGKVDALRLAQGFKR